MIKKMPGRKPKFQLDSTIEKIILDWLDGNIRYNTFSKLFCVHYKVDYKRFRTVAQLYAFRMLANMYRAGKIKKS